MSEKFENVSVVGMHFRGEHAKQYAAALQPGDELFLEAEPDNPYDQNAIKVLAPSDEGEPWHLGYINRADAAWISPHLTPEAEVKVTVERVATAGTGRNSNLYPFVTIQIASPADA